MTDLVNPELTDRQRLACTKVTGRPFQMRPFESLVSVLKNDSTIMVCVKTADLRETSRGWDIRKTGIRVVTWELSDDGTWSSSQIVMWDEECDPVFVRELGRGKSPEEYRDSIIFAMDCHRPGTERAPLDNATRTFEHRELSPAKMLAHWER